MAGPELPSKPLELPWVSYGDGAAVVPWSGKAFNKYVFIPETNKGHLFLLYTVIFF